MGRHQSCGVEEETKHVLLIDESVTYPTERGPERSQQPSGNYQGAINTPNQPARSLQMGAPDLCRTGFEKRPQSISSERLCRRGPHWHAAQPPVRATEIQAAHPSP